MNFKKIIKTIKEKLLDTEKCDDCNELMTECDCGQDNSCDNSNGCDDCNDDCGGCN